MTSLELRLTAIERRLHVLGPRLVIIKGGIPTPDGPQCASAGNHRWERFEGEPLEAFTTRVLALAKHTHLSVVVIGELGPPTL